MRVSLTTFPSLAVEQYLSHSSMRRRLRSRASPMIAHITDHSTLDSWASNRRKTPETRGSSKQPACFGSKGSRVRISPLRPILSLFYL